MGAAATCAAARTGPGAFVRSFCWLVGLRAVPFRADQDPDSCTRILQRRYRADRAMTCFSARSKGLTNDAVASVSIRDVFVLLGRRQNGGVFIGHGEALNENSEPIFEKVGITNSYTLVDTKGFCNPLWRTINWHFL
jgi:hypothetical protein